MTASIIDGKQTALDIRLEIGEAVKKLTEEGKRAPGLAVVLVGENPASQFYVRSKAKACKEAGIYSRQIDYPSDISEEKLLATIEQLNGDGDIDGILVQLPLPDHIDEQKVIDAISPKKDVDGFHAISVGELSLGRDSFVPCTPLGVKELLIRYNVETSGAFAVVLGRSNIVGKPMAQLLMNRGKGGNATVCVCHSGTKNLAEVTKQADILVAAIGKPEFVTKDMVKEGAVVIDVGINRVDDSTKEKGYRVCGDVDFENVKEIASQITPVPGGVGPMTIAMLLKNTLDSYLRRN